MRAMCINACPISGHGNEELYLLKEGRVYDVIDVHPILGSYNIGVRTIHCIERGLPCYWGSERFLLCEDSPPPEVPGKNEFTFFIKLNRESNGKKSSSEEDQGSDSCKPI